MNRFVARRLLPAVALAIAAVVAFGGPPSQAGPPAGSPVVNLHLLAINDFHGGLESRVVNMRPAGGAAALAAHFAERRGTYAHSLTVHAGDMIGASPPVSNLLRDEPTLTALDLLGVEFGAVGNHEFDRGVAELRRLQFGGCDAANNCYPGTRMQYLAANVIDRTSGQPIFSPYVVRQFEGIPVGFIGLTLKETPTIVTPSGVAGLTFEDEVDTINRYVAELQAMGIRAIVVLLHQGGRGTLDGGEITGDDINRIATGVSDAVDVIVSGHSHQGYQGMIAGKLVTQSFSNGTAFADIDLDLDRATGDIVRRQAEIVTAYTDTLAPDAAVEARVQAWRDEVRPIIEQEIGVAAVALSREETAAGESALGNLIADSMRAAMGTQIACVNPGGIRADLDAGPATYGDLFTIQPFGNDLVQMALTGMQLERVLNLQWDGQPFPRILKCSGMTYTWDAVRPPESRVRLADVRLSDGGMVTADGRYTITVNNFLADGGDNFTVLREGTERVVGPVDLAALIEYILALPQPFTAVTEGRIMRLN